MLFSSSVSDPSHRLILPEAETETSFECKVIIPGLISVSVYREWGRFWEGRKCFGIMNRLIHWETEIQALWESETSWRVPAREEAAEVLTCKFPSGPVGGSRLAFSLPGQCSLSLSGNLGKSSGEWMWWGNGRGRANMFVILLQDKTLSV